MRRTFASMPFVRTLVGATVMLAASIAAAGPIKYAGNAVGIRAGVLICDGHTATSGGNTVDLNDAPFVWYNLDQSTLVKPAGWYFYNPHAPTQVTSDISQRWTTLSAITGGIGPTAIGSQIVKSDAPYWEVQLSSITDTAMNDYDVLVLPWYSGMLSLNPVERTRLERFVDHGGVLWIDVAPNTTVDAANAAPLGFDLVAGNTQLSQVNPVGQIFSYPYALTYLPEAGNNPRSLQAISGGTNGYTALPDVLSPVTTEFSRYEVEALSGGLPTVVVGHIGDGSIIVTSRTSASFLNQVLINGAETQQVGFASANGGLDANANQVGRFAINMINLANGSPQANMGAHGTNGSPIDATAPLLREWSNEESDTGTMLSGNGLMGAPPVTYKGLVLFSAGNHVYAYSAVPGSDLDMDGNPDDGIQDFGYGYNRDLIWESTALTAPISAPVALEVPQAAGKPPIDVVAVVDGTGKVFTFDAFPILNNVFIQTLNAPIGSYSAPGGATTVAASLTTPPFAPIVHDGLIYVTDTISSNPGGNNNARVWVVDPSSNYTTTSNYINSNWAVGGGGGTGTIPAFINAASGSVTIGDIPIADNSGGVDTVAYLPTAPVPGTSPSPCGIASLWIATRGEKHAIPSTYTSGQFVIATRADLSGRQVYQQGLSVDPRGIHLVFETSNGTPITGAQEANIISSVTYAPISGLTITLTGGGAGLIASLGITSVSVDYYIDWSYSSQYAMAVRRGFIQMPDVTSTLGTAPTKQIMGNLALSPAGTLYAVVAEPSPAGEASGMMLAMREQGQGTFNVIARFDLYDAFNYIVPGATTATTQSLPATLEDNDATQNLVLPGFTASQLLGGKFTGLSFTSGPAVADGRVFVKAVGYKHSSFGFNVPCTVLLCFAAEPQLPSFTVPLISSTFTLMQPDYNRSTDKTEPDAYNSYPSSLVGYTASTETATISLTSLSTTQQNQLSNVLSESMPIIIRQVGVPDITVDPSTVGIWSPLQWYTLFYGVDPGGTTAGGSPVTTGNTVFGAGNSVLPWILEGLPPLSAKPTGMLFGFNAGLSPTTDAFGVPNVARPYFTQIEQLKITGTDSGGFSLVQGNPDLLWPQNTNITNGNQFLQRVFQTTLDGPNLNVATLPTAFGLSVGQGTLFAYSQEGIYGYKRANFTVADEARLASFDPGGNALWATDQSLSYGIGVVAAAGQSNPAVSKAIIRPTRAYSVGGNQYLVTDPGSNRLSLIDQSGQEIRSIDGFSVDPNYQPDGYVVGESLTFSQPSDVVTFTNYPAAIPFSNAQAVEFWRHYLIADTGNRRLIEIVDRYNVDPTTHLPTTPIALGVLYYHSPASLSGKKGYDYNSISRLQLPGTGTSAANPAQFLYATSLGQTEVTGTGLGTTPTGNDITNFNTGTAPFQAKEARDGNGGILVINGANTQIINQVWVPPLPNGLASNATPIPGHYKKLGGINSVTMANNPTAGPTGGPNPTIMFTDSSGIYEITFGATTGSAGNVPGQDWVVDWMLPWEVYTQLRRNPYNNALVPSSNPTELKATYARRTTAGTVLVVNGYFGTYQDGSSFPGEILELDGSSVNATSSSTRGFTFNSPYLGFDALSIWFELPSVQGARGIIAPIFANRQ